MHLFRQLSPEAVSTNILINSPLTHYHIFDGEILRDRKCGQPKGHIGPKLIAGTPVHVEGVRDQLLDLTHIFIKWFSQQKETFRIFM